MNEYDAHRLMIAGRENPQARNDRYIREVAKPQLRRYNCWYRRAWRALRRFVGL